jgi:hypothetical protein
VAAKFAGENFFFFKKRKVFARTHVSRACLAVGVERAFWGAAFQSHKLTIEEKQMRILIHHIGGSKEKNKLRLIDCHIKNLPISTSTQCSPLFAVPIIFHFDQSCL